MTKKDVRLVLVRQSEIQILRDYISNLYHDDQDQEALVNIEAGLNSMMKYTEISTPYFIYSGEARIGYAILIKYPSVEKGGLILFVDELYVEPTQRNQGVGGVILDRIKDHAKELGAKNVWVQAEHYNEGAIQFFKKHGFIKNQHVNFEYQV